MKSIQIYLSTPFFFMPFNLQNNGFLMLPDLSLSAKLLNSFKTKKPEKSKKKFF